MILLRSVSKQFRRKGRRILDDISVSFPARSRTAILGPRGSGKTTLLKLLCGLEPPTDGWIDRRMSVSFPVGLNIRTPRKFTIRQFLTFAARVHAIDADDLAAFVIRSTRMNPDMTRPISEIGSVERRRINFVLGYALPFDCYLFDETIGGGSKSDLELFAKLFEMRSANAATILATRSIKTLQQYYNENTDVYLLHDKKLIYFSEVDEAIAVFRTLPETAETREVVPRAMDSDDDEWA